MASVPSWTPQQHLAALTLLASMNNGGGRGGGGGFNSSFANAIPAPTYGGSSGGGGDHGMWSNLGHGLWGGLGNVLGTPLAAVTSTIKEGGQGLDHLFGLARKGEGNFSFSDWGNQIWHPSDRVSTNDIFFGNQAKNMQGGTGPIEKATHLQDVTNPLARAGIGLASSVAVDPLTWVGGIGETGSKALAEEIATQTVKKAAAAAALHAGLDAVPTSALEAGKLVEQFKAMPDVAKILSEGSSATAQARRLGVAGKGVADFVGADGAKVAERGLQVGGREGSLLPAVKIPFTGSGPLAKFGDIYAGAKAAAGDAILGSKASGLINTDRELKLAARSGSPAEAFPAVLTGLAKGGAKAEGHSLARTLATEYTNAVGGLNEGEKALAYRIAGGDAMAAADAPKIVTDAAQGIRAFYDKAHGLAADSGVKLGTVENYLPRTMTPADRTILQDAGVLPKNGAKFMGSAHFFGEQARKLVPDEAGNYSFLGKTFQAPNGEADVRAAMTQIAHDAVAAKDPQLAEKLGGFFNPNHDASAAQYIHGLSSRIAQAKAAARLYAGGIGTGGAAVGAHALEDTAVTPKALEAGPARFVGGTETVAGTTRPTIIDRWAGDAKHIDPTAPVAATSASTAHAAVSMDDRAVQLLKEPPEATAAKVQSLQQELQAVQHSVDTGAVSATPQQQRDLYEYMTARQQQIGAASARASASTPEAARAAALAESAAELRATAAANGQGLAKQAIQYGNLSDRQYAAIADLVKSGAARELHAGLGTPREVADWMAFASRLADPQELKTVLKGWDHVVQTLRNYEMLYPGFYPKIFLGHYMNNLPAGVELGDYGAMLKLLRGDAKGTLSEADAAMLSNIRKATGRGEVGGQYDNPRTALESLMGKPTSGTWNPASPRFKVFNGTRAIGDKVTEVLRGALAHRVLSDGGTVDQAVSKIAHYQFDYQDLTPFEQGLRRHLIPFYTFTRNNLPLQIEQLIKNPKYMARFFEAKQNVEALSPPDKSTPDFFKSTFNIRMPWQMNGGATYFNPQMPQQDLAKFVNDPKAIANNLLGMVSPIVKTPIESRLGKTFQEGIPLPTSKFVPLPAPIAAIPWLGDALDRIGVTHKVGGQQFMNYRDAYVMEQALPLISRWRRLMPQEASYQDRRLTSLLSFLGIPMSANTALQQAGQAKGVKAQTTLDKQRERGLQKAALALQQMNGG